MLHYREYLLNDKNIERDVLKKVFNNRVMEPDNFYQTGYEYIPFAKDRTFALETILASVIKLDKELLIINSGEESILPVELCLANDINYKVVKTVNNSPDQDKIQVAVNNNPNITHACISLTDETLRSFDLNNTITILNAHNIDTIIDFSGNVAALADIDINSFDFLAGNTGYNNVSFVAARRNKLVLTEGNARSYAKDLHAFWQQTLHNRKRKIEPLYL